MGLFGTSGSYYIRRSDKGLHDTINQLYESVFLLVDMCFYGSGTTGMSRSKEI